MSSGGSSGTQEIRYAPYLEAAHKEIIGTDDLDWDLFSALNEAFDSSPYSDYGSYNPERGFFGYKADGTTLWQLENFPSLYDMFGKFMAGLDVCTLWGKVYEDVVHGAEINDSIAAHSAVLKDEIDTTIMPSYIAGMRDINAIQSSAFVVGKALMYDTHTKAVNQFAGDLRIHAIDVTTQIWAKHLDWNTSVVTLYGKTLLSYFETKLSLDNAELEFLAKDELWNLNLFEYGRSVIGMLNGAAAAQGVNEPSGTQKIVGGAMSGAAMGSMVPGVGTIAGGVIGGLAGAFL